MAESRTARRLTVRCAAAAAAAAAIDYPLVNAAQLARFGTVLHGDGAAQWTASMRAVFNPAIVWSATHLLQKLGTVQPAGYVGQPPPRSEKGSTCATCPHLLAQTVHSRSKRVEPETPPSPAAGWRSRPAAGGRSRPAAA